MQIGGLLTLIFIDGKRILFSDQNSLFNQILTASEGRLKMSRQNIALAMQKEEIHQDVYDFFEILSHTTID